VEDDSDLCLSDDSDNDKDNEVASSEGEDSSDDEVDESKLCIFSPKAKKRSK